MTDLKDLFNFMKKLGKFEEYKDYEDYKLKKFGEPSKFKDTLSAEDREKYETMFGKEDYDNDQGRN